MGMISVSQPDEHLRWFHARDPEEQKDGPWHLGLIAVGRTWPCGPATCGYNQPDKAKGRHITAGEVLANEQDFCPKCLATYNEIIEDQG